MSLIPSVTVGNNSVTTSTFIVTDTSTGSDAAIANRLIYIYLADNSLFTGAPIQFPLSAGTSISPSILTQDFAYSITVNWVDSSGNVLYQVSGQLGVFTGFLEWFYYGLTQEVAANSVIMNDVVFFYNWSNLRNLIDSANNSITIGGSIYNAQNMILLAQGLANNSNLNF
jgi:hypothetical protein